MAFTVLSVGKQFPILPTCLQSNIFRPKFGCLSTCCNKKTYHQKGNTFLKLLKSAKILPTICLHPCFGLFLVPVSAAGTGERYPTNSGIIKIVSVLSSMTAALVASPSFITTSSAEFALIAATSSLPLNRIVMFSPS